MNKKKKGIPNPGFFEKHITIVLSSLLILSVLIVYVQSSRFEFVNIDDRSLIYENPTVINPKIPYSECFQRMKGGVHYKPLVFASWKLEYNLWGDDPSHFHTINWILHLLNTILLFYIMIDIFGKIYDSRRKSIISAFFVALFFTINPLRIESVAWATERKDVLFAFFFLIGWMLYLKYLLKNSYIYLVLGAIAYALSGLSKSMGITLIVVILLTDFWFQRKFSWKMLVDKIPYLIVLLVLSNLYGLVDFHTESVQSVSSMETVEGENLVEPITNVETLSGMPLAIKWFFTTSVRYILWIAHSYIPVKISIHYPHNEVYGYLGKLIYLFPLLILGIFYGAWRYRHKNIVILAGLLFFTITLSPALIIKSSGQAIFLSDRYTYIPSIGLFFMLVGILNYKKNNLTYFLYGFFVLFFLIQSLIHVKYWRNSGELFEQALKINPNSGLAHINLGKYYYDENKVAEAVQVYTRGINRDPAYYKLYSNLGKLYFEQGQKEKAIEEFNKCLSIKPDHITALVNRAAAYGSMGDYEKARVDLDMALKIKPRDENGLATRGLLYLLTKEYDKAIQDYMKYIELYPNNADIFNALGLCYYNLNKNNEAIIEFGKAIQINANNGAYFYNRSLVYNKLGEWNLAYQDVMKATALGEKVNPNYVNSLRSSL
ncbi:tetratricopeptide repeat protein [Maribellus sediminis]|uniref:tetratricopeptide repeat protein n=1 Tax=Maribellus sediminis TaxID=2696285 RepID=UPI001430213D|nr:tetratricopeptide repeat protein [Maribellus sediminis]